jgi:hypothetical protein
MVAVCDHPRGGFLQENQGMMHMGLTVSSFFLFGCLSKV